MQGDAKQSHTVSLQLQPVAATRRPSTARTLLFAANILTIFAVALALRIGYWQDARAYALGGDEPDYVIPAQTLDREGRYVDTYISNNRIWTRVPLTAIFFAGSFLFAPDSAAAGAQGDDAALMEPRYDALNIAQIIASLVTVALTMLLAARCFPQKPRGAALAAGYISALYPPLASSPAQRALSEPLSTMLIFAAVYALSFWKPRGSWRSMLGVAALAGLLLGVATLARSVGIAMLPFACLWFVITYVVDKRSGARSSGFSIEESPAEEAPETSPSAPARRFAPLRWVRYNVKPLVCAVMAAVACFLAIAPWTYYNYRQYGSFLLLETANTTAYWHYHNFKRENEDAILRQYPNPADRLSVIISKGTENIREYPDQAVGESIFAFFYAWHLESNSAVLENPWDMTQRDPDVPDLLHSDAAFLLVGLAGLAGLAGVGLRRPVGPAGRTLLIINLWLLVMLVLGVVVPYDARYRLPAAPALIIMASGLLVLADWRSVFSPRRAWAILRGHPWTGAFTLALCAWVLAGAYTPSIPPLLQSLYQAWRGDIASSPAEALDHYNASIAAFPSFYWPYRHEADALRREGKDDQARSMYMLGWSRNPDDPYGILGFADLAARHPEWQLTADERNWLNRDEAQWRGNPWNSFQPSPTGSIDVGTGRDIPYILGFYMPDRSANPAFDYRWSRGRSTIRIPVPAGQSYNAVTLRMSAPGIGPPVPMPVSISANGAPPTVLQVPSGWADYSVPLPPGAGEPGKMVILTITSPTRSPAQFESGSPDTRNLGVGLERVTLTGTPARPGEARQTALSVANVAASPQVTGTSTSVPVAPDMITPIQTNTAQSAYPPPRLAGTKEAAWTAVAEYDNELSTEVALTHAPTRTPGEPPIYPTATPEMGILRGCAMTSSRGPQCYNSWRGVLNGEIVQVDAGHEGSDGDESQGLLRVWTWTTHASDIYLTPQRVGWIEILSVDGMRFTLGIVQSPWTTATPGTTFTFDLATRQWILPTPGPSPSVSISPLPSVSPLPTQQP